MGATPPNAGAVVVVGQANRQSLLPQRSSGWGGVGTAHREHRVAFPRTSSAVWRILHPWERGSTIPTALHPPSRALIAARSKPRRLRGFRRASRCSPRRRRVNGGRSWWPTPEEFAWLRRRVRGTSSGIGPASRRARSLPLIELAGVEKSYRMGRLEYPALPGIDLSIGAANWSRSVGPSGSGKTTILNLAAGIDRPTAGRPRSGPPTRPALCRETQASTRVPATSPACTPSLYSRRAQISPSRNRKLRVLQGFSSPLRDSNPGPSPYHSDSGAEPEGERQDPLVPPSLMARASDGLAGIPGGDLAQCRVPGESDPQLGEHVAQVPLDGAGTEEQARALSPGSIAHRRPCARSAAPAA